jgi:hypothetical protein
MANKTVSQRGFDQNDLVELLVEMQQAINELRTSVTTLTAQLDADAGVTDTDYAANCDPTITQPTLDVTEADNLEITPAGNN